MSIRHFVISMKCTAQHKQGKLLKNEKQARKHVYQASYFQYQQNPFNQTQQNKPKPYMNMFFKSQQ